MQNWPVLLAVGAAIVVIAVVFVAARRNRKPRAQQGEARPDIAVERLDGQGPRTQGPVLCIRGVAVRVAAVVVAPLGRGASVPPVENWSGILDTLLPGLAEVVQRDKPLMRPWPGQLSREGFNHAVSHAAALPGDRGRDTPWCLVTGPVTWQSRPLMVCLIGRAAQPNPLIPIYVPDEAKWSDAVSIR